MALDPTPATKVSLQTQSVHCKGCSRTCQSCETSIPFMCVYCLYCRVGADRGHCKVRLCGPKSERAFLQEGSLSATLHASLRGLVGGPTQRRGRADPTSVHCGTRHVSKMHFLCGAHNKTCVISNRCQYIDLVKKSVSWFCCWTTATLGLAIIYGALV